MDAPVTKDDLRELRDEIRDHFRVVYQKQDLTNGRIGKAEVSLAEHRVQLTSLERETSTCFLHRRSSDSSPREHERDGDKEATAITRRDVALFAAGIGGGVAFLVWVVPIIKALAQ